MNVRLCCTIKADTILVKIDWSNILPAYYYGRLHAFLENYHEKATGFVRQFHYYLPQNSNLTLEKDSTFSSSCV
jgi:hypothetical protein